MADKVDKGFCLAYWKLSRRRKFIRTLWCTPFAIIAIALVFYSYYRLESSFLYAIAMTVLIVVALIAQLAFTFHKWKKKPS